MLYHPRHATRTSSHRSTRSKTSPTARGLSQGSPGRRLVRYPWFFLRRFELCVCGCKEGGDKAGCAADFRLGRGGLPFGRRHLARTQAVVRSFPSFHSHVVNVAVEMTFPSRRCPQLKSIGVGFGALLPSVRSHVGLSSHWSSYRVRRDLIPCRSHSYSTSRTLRVFHCGSSLRFTATGIPI